MPRVYVAAGSNVEPGRHLTRAVAELESAFGPVTCSRWYRNRAVGFEGPDFVNLAAGFDTPLEVEEVIARLRHIEALCGRPREAPKWAPRSMDLDLLLYGDRVSSEPPLPRPDLLRRAYMLGPLAEIAPGLVHPTAGATLAELWERFDREAHPLEPIAPAPTTPRSGPRRSRAPGR